MPITQERMVELIAAAVRINNASQEFRAFVRNEFDEVTLHSKDPEKALFAIIESLTLSQPDSYDVAKLLEEQRYFQTVWARNLKKAEKAKQLRQRLGRNQKSEI